MDKLSAIQVIIIKTGFNCLLSPPCHPQCTKKYYTVGAQIKRSKTKPIQEPNILNSVFESFPMSLTIAIGIAMVLTYGPDHLKTEHSIWWLA